MRRFLAPPIVALLISGLASADARERPSDLEAGPLPVRDHFLLGVGFLALEPAAADLLAAGRWQLEAVWSISNSWAVSPQIDLALRARERAPVSLELLDELARRSSDGGSIFVDGEVSRAAIALRRGIGRGIELQVVVPLVTLHGGHLDGPIEGFHDALSLARDGRSGASRDAFLVSLTTRRVDFLAREAPSSGLGDIVVGAKFRIRGGRGSALRAAVETLVKLPTADGEPLATSGEVDVGAQLLLTRALGRWALHGSAGVVLLGASERLGLDSQELVSATLGVERVVGRRTSFLVQVAAAQSPFRRYATSRIGLTAIQATLGIKRRLGRRHQLFVAATDNFENFTNSADLDFHLGLRRQIR